MVTGPPTVCLWSTPSQAFIFILSRMGHGNQTYKWRVHYRFINQGPTWKKLAGSHWWEGWRQAPTRKKKAVSQWRSSGQLCRHRWLTNLSWEMHLWPSAGSTKFSYVPWIVHCQGTSQYVSVLYIAFLNYVHDTYIVSVYPQWIYENDFCNWISLMYLRIQFHGTNGQAHLTKSLYVFQISNKEIEPFESISFYIF